MTTTPSPKRPSWAHSLDRLALLLGRAGRRLLGRPGEATLSALARQDRPGLDIVLPPSTVDRLESGRRAFAEGRHADALHLFGQILREDPDHAWAWHGRGDALQLLGAHADARAAYLRAAALQPDEALHRAGVANAERGLAADGEDGVTWGGPQIIVKDPDA